MAETLDPARRREAAYWLAFAFHMKGEPRSARNALVLTAHRACGLDLMALVRMAPTDLPEKLRPLSGTHERFLAEEGRASAQAFVVDRLFESGVTVIPITDSRYPAHLAQRVRPAQAPTVLLVAGDPMLLQTTGIAVSGSRRAGDDGLRFARAAGEAVARAGGILVSGMARGVDREALDGALDSGGRAVGVAAEGILNVRARKAPEVEDGRLAIVSEFEPTQKWMPGLAMQRNTTIAGLSRALIVADCVEPGGTVDQIETHRKLEMPIFIRRGRGEGALVAEMARRPGVQGVPWDGGQVRIPSLFGTAAPWTTCDIRRSPDAVEIQVRAAPDVSLEDVIDTIRAEWDSGASAPSAVGSGDAPATGVSEGPPSPPTPQPPPVVESIASSPSADPVLGMLRSRAPTAMHPAEIATATGMSENQVQKRLRSLAEAGDVLTVKDGRRKLYRLAPPSKQDHERGSGAAASRPAPSTRAKEVAPRRQPGPTLFGSEV